MTTQSGFAGHQWSVAEAKARFSRMIEEALQRPQVITKNGKETVVVVAYEEWGRRTKRRGNLAEFFAGSPLRGSGLNAERLEDGPREIAL